MGTAGNDLFSSDFTTGDLSKIQPIVRVGQFISVAVISITGFAIVISTILKQTMHGLYATQPKLWDRVDEVHRMKAAQMLGKIKGGGNEIQETIGFLFNLVFSILPNVKAITEFEDDTVDTKTFFTKSLPSACVFMFIGVFIFYGYTAKFGEKVAGFGTTIIDNYFMQIDPIEWAAKIPTSFARLTFSSDNALGDHEAQINKVAKKAVSAYLSDINDVEKDMQTRLALEIEDWVRANMTDLTLYTDKNAYSMTYTAFTTPAKTNNDAVNGVTSNSGRTYQVSFQEAVNYFKSGSALSQMDTDYLRVDLQFTKVAEKDTTVSVTSTLTGGSMSANTSSGVITINLGSLANDNGASLSLSSKDGYLVVGGEEKKGTVTMTTSEGDTILTYTGTAANVASATSNASNVTIKVSLVYGIGGKNHQVTAVTTNSSYSGRSLLFTPVSNSTVSPWTFGENPNEGSSSSDNSGDSGNDDNGDDVGGDALS